jgi:Protein of unknown function (DUF3017)
MANRPVNTGSGGAAAPPPDAAPPFDAAPPYDTAPPFHAAPPFYAAPPPVHHDALSGAVPVAPPAASRNRVGHRAARDQGTARLAWLPYLIVLAGAAAGMFVAWQGSKYAGRGAGLIGASLLAAALARLILPARYAGLLSSRRKASDVLAFAVFGAAVLAVAIALP